MSERTLFDSVRDYPDVRPNFQAGRQSLRVKPSQSCQRNRVKPLTKSVGCEHESQAVQSPSATVTPFQIRGRDVQNPTRLTGCRSVGPTLIAQAEQKRLHSNELRRFFCPSLFGKTQILGAILGCCFSDISVTLPLLSPGDFCRRISISLQLRGVQERNVNDRPCAQESRFCSAHVCPHAGIRN
jgi:hypothetical protein